MSIVSDSSSNKSVRTNFAHPLKARDYVSLQMGIFDGEEGFDRFFKSGDQFVRLLGRIQVFLDRGLLYSKKGPKEALSKVQVERLKQIWFGPTWMVVKRDPVHLSKIIWKKIAYKQYPLSYDMEAIKQPALRNLNPVDQVKSEKFTLRLREPIRIPEAYGGMEYKQVVLQGKWYHDFKFNRKPIFNSQSDIEHSKGITMTVGRRYFHATINFLGQYFAENLDIIYADIQQILQDDMQKGFDDIKEEKVTKKWSDSVMD